MMKLLSRLLGNLLILTSVVGAGYVAVRFLEIPLATPEAPGRPVVSTGLQPSATGLSSGMGGSSAPRVVAPVAAGGAAGEAQPVLAAPAAALVEPRPITRLTIDGVGIDTEVVPADLVEKNGGTVWEVPAFKAGHAQYTAGAGQPGTAVLLGHVSSVRSGNVFERLDRMQIGDTVQAFSGDQAFPYQVTEILTVSRTDVGVMAPTETPTLAMFTCTGTWLPTIWDYTERLVVRAALVS